MIIVSARPFPRLGPVVQRWRASTQVGAQLAFFLLGRHALQFAATRLGVKPGDAILVPALFCESSLEPLRRSGFRLAFVDVDVNLQVPRGQIRQAVCSSDVRAAIFVNYFGVIHAHPTAVLRSAGCGDVATIEDCAHSCLMINGALYEGGDSEAVIYSLRKILPIPDGGAVRLRGGLVKRERACPTPIINTLLYVSSRSAERAITALGWPNIYSAAVDAFRSRMRQRRKADNSVIASIPSVPSPLLQRLLASPDELSSIARIRLSNYETLSRLIADTAASLRFLPMPSTLVPQALVVIDESRTLASYLRRRGIGAYRWPGDDLPAEVLANPERFPNAVRLNNEMVCLPIHQDISHGQISHISGVIKKWATTVQA